MALADPVDTAPRVDGENGIRKGLSRYYTRYYRDLLGLPDWSPRVEARLREEELFAEPMLRRIETWLDHDFEKERVLVVGAGTGAESSALVRRGAAVVSLEPDREARGILREKARARGRALGAIVAGAAESIPLPDDRFDFVYCHTVLEHCDDVERSVDEMIRVCRPGGWVFIQTPDYRFPWEGHYKLRLVPFAPRWVQALSLRLRGRPTGFLAGIRFVTAPQLDRLLWKRDVLVLRAYEPHLLWWRGGGDRFSRWFCERFAIHKHQVLFLRKQGARPPVPDGAARP